MMLPNTNLTPSDSAPDRPASADYEFAALEHAENYRAALIRQFSPYLRGNVVEVGAGIGQISQGLVAVPTLEKLTAIEPSARLAREFHARLPHISIIEGTIEACPERRPDAIVSINVLEHIEQDRRELATYADLLRPRAGHLCLFVPARQEIYAPLDKDSGHFRRYDKPELKRKLEHAGFQLLRLDYCNSVGYLAWWLNFRVLKKRSFDPRQVKLFDRLVFPIVHALENRLGAPPVGQSLIAIGRAH